MSIDNIVEQIGKKGYSNPQEIYKKFRKEPLERFYIQKWLASNKTLVIIKVCPKDDKSTAGQLLRECDNLRAVKDFKSGNFRVGDMDVSLKFQQYHDFWEDDRYLYLVSEFADSDPNINKYLLCEAKIEILQRIIEYCQEFNEIEKFPEWYNILSVRTLTKLMKWGVLSDELCEKMLSLEAVLGMQEIASLDSVLVHTDLTGLNLMAKMTGKTDLSIAIIDLEGLRQGPPIFEYASLYFLGQITKRLDLKKYENFDGTIDCGWFPCIAKHTEVFRDVGVACLPNRKLGSELFRLNLLRQCISRLNYYATLVRNEANVFDFYKDCSDVIVEIVEENLE